MNLNSPGYPRSSYGLKSAGIDDGAAYGLRSAGVNNKDGPYGLRSAGLSDGPYTPRSAGSNDGFGGGGMYSSKRF